MKIRKIVNESKLFVLSLIKNPKYFYIFLKNIRNNKIFNIDKHIELATLWLLKAQETGSDYGYSRGFYLYKKNGWDRSYIETSGYIIQTLLEVYDETENIKYKESALLAGEWLLQIQQQSGAFTEIDRGKELVFDTGQVLYGLISIYERDDIDKVLKDKYKKAIINAAQWLCSVQDKNGSWKKYGYYGIAHSYYSRVGFIIYKTGILFNNTTFKDYAKRNIDWVLSKQSDNGFFQNLNFMPNEDKYVLHSMIYVLEGLLDYYLQTKDKFILNAVLKNAVQLKKININRDIILYSQYDDQFAVQNREKCMTGLAQWSALAFKLYEITKDSDYLLCARKTLYYLKSKQFKEGEDLEGALPGSVPFWGFYAPFSAVNWGVKFFLDALLISKKYPIGIIDESKLWIGECFKFQKEVVNVDFSYTAKQYLKTLEKYIRKEKNILDLGCGKGRYIEYFDKKGIEIYGIDPVFFNEKNIKQGDIYSIDFNIEFDIIYAIEVLQHVKYLDIGFGQISKKLKKGGYLIICDRNKNSLKGYLKPFLEYKEKWMYPFDSPFIEKWYGLNEWQTILEKNNFSIENIKSFNTKVGKLGWINKYNIIVARKL